MLFLKLFAFFNVTKFQFLVILSENLSIGFERKTWLLNSLVFLVPLFAYRTGDFQFLNDVYFLVSKLII